MLFKNKARLGGLVIGAALSVSAAQAQLATKSGAIETRVGPIELELGVPTNGSIDKLYDQLDFASAYLAYI